MSAEPVPSSSGENRGVGSGDQPTRDRYIWPLLAIVAVILSQVLVPADKRVGPPHIVPVVETLVVLALSIIAARPGNVPPRARPLVLFLFSALIFANALAASRLVLLVISGRKVDGVELTADRLLIGGLLVLSANVITFGLLYWQLDSGGPTARAAKTLRYPDFQFPQTQAPGLAAPDWRPRFADYLYLAFTNVVAFSPTDTMPLTIRVKALMALQSVVAFAVLVVVLSRVINILPG